MPQGFLRVPAYLTRAGVLLYANADGTPRREWRPLAEVMRGDSLATLISAPVTQLHPPEMITADNREKYDRGNVGDHIVRDGGKVSATLYIKDGRLIAAVERGDLREVSAGYVCKLDATSGVVPDGEPDAGQHYDAIQRNIVYNHVAAVPMGRAGDEIRMRLDVGGDAILAPRADVEWSTAYINDLPDSAFLYIEAGSKKDDEGKTTPRSLRHFPVRDTNGKLDLPHLRNALSRIPQSSLPVSVRERLAVEARRLLEGVSEPRTDTSEETMKVEVIGGMEYEVGSVLHQDAVARRDKAEKDRKDAEDAKQAQLDKAKADLDALQKKLDALPAELEQKAQDRAELVEKARQVLDAEFKFDGLDDAAIRLAVAKKANPALVELGKLDSASPAYVQALFDGAVAGDIERRDDEDDLAQQRQVARGKVTGGGRRERGDAVDEYARAIEETEAANRTLWQHNDVA